MLSITRLWRAVSDSQSRSSASSRRMMTSASCASSGDPPIEDVPVEDTLELGSVVGLDDLDLEREFLEHVVDELDRRMLVVSRVDL